MVTNTKMQRTLLLSTIALMFTVGLALAVFSDVSPPVHTDDRSLRLTHMSVPAYDVQSEIVLNSEAGEKEPEKTIGPVIALGMLGVGFGVGVCVIYRCRKEKSDSPSE